MESLEEKKWGCFFFFRHGKLGESWVIFFQIWKVWTERYSWQKSWNLWKFHSNGSKVSENLDLAWGWMQQRGSLLLSSFLLPGAISTLCSRFHCCPSSLLIIRCLECWWAPAGFKISLSLIPLDYPLFGVLVSASRKGILCRCNWCKSVNMVCNVHKPQGLLGMGRRGGRGYGGGGRGRFIYLSPHCHHRNDSCIKIGSDESHFNVSLLVRKKKSQKPQPFWRKRRAKAESSQGPSAYQPIILQLSQTSSQ